ncbi:MAG: hypothetical protein GY791_04875 [Alphaproteobacteria bacterium]|nr:hypothetical protein [Alphaproteobacteria bacterium]
MAGSVAVTVLVAMAAGNSAVAQSTPNVIVDLSVLNVQGGYAPYPPPNYGGAPAYAAPQPYGTVPQGYGAAPQPYGTAPQGYGAPPQGYGAAPQGYVAVPQGYGAVPQPYGAAPTYGRVPAYSPPPAVAQTGPTYGGYLLVPNSGFGPPQPTLLAPQIRPPSSAVASAPRTTSPTPLVPAVRQATPTATAAVAPAVAQPPAAPVAQAKPAPQAVPAAPPALATSIATTMPAPAVAEGSADPADTEPAADEMPAASAATIAVPPSPIVQPSQPKAPPSATAPEPAAVPALAQAPAAVAQAPAAVEVPPPAAATEQVQVAARTPAAQTVDGDTLSVRFDPGSAEFGDGVELEAVAAQLGDDESLRVRLVAYADGSDEEASKARRLSLSRALAVRGHLIKLGVRSTRMDVRALGNKVEGGDPDRVDVMVVTR